MKKLIIILPVCIILFYGCNYSKSNNTTLNADSVSLGKNKNNTRSSLSDTDKSNRLKKQIFGVWLIKGETATDFEIRKDSIYYIGQNKSFKYILTKDDTLVIYFDGYINKSKVLVNKDTLILRGDNIDYFIRNK
jgi:hypothetical protein